MLSESVRSMEIRCFGIDTAVLQSIFHRCPSLTIFSCSSTDVINWPEALSATNVIEKLTINGPNDFIAYLLSTCRYLTTASFSDCALTREMIPSLATVIKNYRHAVTGSYIHCKCKFKFRDSIMTVHEMEYRFGHFSGKVWVDCMNKMDSPFKTSSSDVKP